MSAEIGAALLCADTFKGGNACRSGEQGVRVGQAKAPDSDLGSGAVPKLQRNCREPILDRTLGDTVGNYLGPACVALPC